MNQQLTHIAFILDRSGSMASMAEEAIGGFNAFVEEQRKEPGDVRISLILFDHAYSPLVTDVPIQEMPPLTAAGYDPRGTTALLDAMGRTIDDLGKTLAALPETERPGNVIVVTLTDGLENASSDYTKARVAGKVKHQQEKYDWQFLFLGASLDAVEQADALHIAKANQTLYSSVADGMALNSKEIVRRRRERRREEKQIGFHS